MNLWVNSMDKELLKERLTGYLKDNTVKHITYWYPLAEIKSGIPAVAYKITDIYKDNHIDLIEKILRKCGIGSVNLFEFDWSELHENRDIFELIYEKDEDGYVFPYLCELFIFDSSEEWLIYISHEHTISFTGKKISKTAKSIISEKYLIDY